MRLFGRDSELIRIMCDLYGNRLDGVIPDLYGNRSEYVRELFRICTEIVQMNNLYGILSDGQFIRGSFRWTICTGMVQMDNLYSDCSDELIPVTGPLPRPEARGCGAT